MATCVTVRTPFKAAGVEYARGQSVDLDGFDPRLARQLAEQLYFIESPAQQFAASGPRIGEVPRGGVTEAALRAALSAARAALAEKDAGIREILEAEHKGHREPVERCKSPRCEALRSVLVAGSAVEADSSKAA